MSEMVDETMDGLDEDAEELDEEADSEVNKVLYEITSGKLGEVAGKTGALPVSHGRVTIVVCSDDKSITQTSAQTEEEDEDPEIMRRQLDALLNG